MRILPEPDFDEFVVGPASATDEAVVIFDGTTGKLVKDSTLTTADLQSGEILAWIGW